MRLLIALIIATLGLECASAQEFGKFIDNPKGEFVQGTDRPLFKLHEDFVFRDPNGLDWVAPKDEVVDGASIPWYAWSLVGGPFSGNYLGAAIIHDYFCCAKNREYHSTHHAFWLGMRAGGVSEPMAWTFWVAVRMRGPDYWSVDPAATPPTPCKSDPSAPSASLAVLDDRTQAIALGKFLGIARTLNTTNGRLMDIVDGVYIEPGTSEAEEHLDFIRTAIEKKFDVDRNLLGISTVVTDAELKAYAERTAQPISAWVQGQIPSLDAYMKEADLKYPEAAMVDGSLYAPFVANDPFQIDISDFAIDLVDK